MTYVQCSANVTCIVTLNRYDLFSTLSRYESYQYDLHCKVSHIIWLTLQCKPGFQGLVTQVFIAQPNPNFTNHNPYNLSLNTKVQRSTYPNLYGKSNFHGKVRTHSSKAREILLPSLPPRSYNKLSQCLKWSNNNGDVVSLAFFNATWRRRIPSSMTSQFRCTCISWYRQDLPNISSYLGSCTSCMNVIERSWQILFPQLALLSAPWKLIYVGTRFFGNYYLYNFICNSLNNLRY